MKKLILLVFMNCLPILNIFAQNIAQTVRQCGSSELLQMQIARNPTLAAKMEAQENRIQAYTSNPSLSVRSAEITIPVVVHVVYNTDRQNISDAQIQSQITVLNQDFRKRNKDANRVPSIFTSIAADCGINFQLANRDINGNPITGIDRVHTNTKAWGTDDAVKSAATGGVNPWDNKSYLNIWVCDLDGGVLGYSTFPGSSADVDGVVIDYHYFGTIGTVSAPFEKGRTATHEIGHFFNLKHIWGDGDCGDDHVSDTPKQAHFNTGVPAFPHYSTCAGTKTIDMTMNYMDYVNDSEMYMFTEGQKARMQAVLNTEESRVALAQSNAYIPSAAGTSSTAALTTPTEAVPTTISDTNLKVYPNPVTDVVSLDFSIQTPQNVNISIFDLQGKIVASIQNELNPGASKITFDTIDFPNGIYIINAVLDSNNTINKKIIVAHSY